MARTVNRLTDKSIKAKKAKGLYPDGAGLYLQVSAVGTKSWIFRFKHSGKARDMGLGSFVVVGLSLARQKAGDARRLCAEGKDPIATKQAQKARERAAAAGSATFKECAEKLIASHEAGWKNDKHKAQWCSTLATYAYPVMGNLPVASINTDHVLKVLEPIWTSKTETASRVRGRIEAVLSWAKARGLRTGENPAAWRGHLDHLLPARNKVQKVQHHPAMLYKDVPAFMARLRKHDGITPRALELTVLTAVRTSEAIGAQFDEFDLKEAVWTIPGERMKAGRAHKVPLSPRAVAIVRDMAGTRLGDYVFPGMKRGESLSNMAMLMLLRDIAPGITVHGFRSSFRDWAAEQTSTPSFVAEAALAHVVADKVEAAYRRSELLEKRRELMNLWTSYCGSVALQKPGKRRSAPPKRVDRQGRISGRLSLPTQLPIREARR